MSHFNLRTYCLKMTYVKRKKNSNCTALFLTNSKNFMHKQSQSSLFCPFAESNRSTQYSSVQPTNFLFTNPCLTRTELWNADIFILSCFRRVGQLSPEQDTLISYVTDIEPSIQKASKISAQGLLEDILLKVFFFFFAVSM